LAALGLHPDQGQGNGQFPSSAGAILLGIAPCAARVLMWGYLSLAQTGQPVSPRLSPPRLG